MFTITLAKSIVRFQWWNRHGYICVDFICSVFQRPFLVLTYFAFRSAQLHVRSSAPTVWNDLQSELRDSCDISMDSVSNRALKTRLLIQPYVLAHDSWRIRIFTNFNIFRKNREFLRILKRRNEFYFFTLLTQKSTAFWHGKVLHFLQGADRKFSDVLIIIQELIHVGYQQSK